MIAGRYRLHSVLGKGSMGTVWAAYDEFLRRPVAVKEVHLPPGFPAAQAEELRERSLREARAIASLSHPNVITLHDVVREGDEPFVVMEQLIARSLSGLLAEHGPLGTGQAASIADAVSAALEAAHAAGITHRDVKPGNVLVAKDGRVKLTDFGISRNISEATLTSTGIMLGSPAYMAPEVASGKKVTAAADLWGLGATLFALVEGHPPYDADGDPLATAHSVVHDEVPTPAEGPLAALITDLMNKDPDERPTLSEVRRRLTGLLQPPGRPLFPSALFEHRPGADPEDHRTEILESAGEGAGDAEPSETDEVADAPAAGVGAPTTEDGAEGSAESAAEGSSEGTAPLATDPGPLPFLPAAKAAKNNGAANGEPTVPRPAPRSGPLVTAVTVAAAVLLFACATLGGFVTARWLGGAELLPVSAEQAVDPPRQVPSARRFVRREAAATMLKGDDAARFSVVIPSDWTRFISLLPGDPLPSSTLVQFVSVDGRQTLGVQRFPEYFPQRDFRAFLDTQRSFWPEGDFVIVQESVEAGAADGDEGSVTYRTVDSPIGGTVPSPERTSLGRTTFVRLIRDDSTLWVVSVTVPTDQETRGRTQLFDKIAPTFRTG